MTDPLTLYYQEPDPDRWLPFDRYPRRLIRRIVRGPHQPGGQMRVFLNLCAGFDRLGVRYRVNDFRYARRNPAAPVGIVGKPHVLYLQDWKNPIMFGASLMSHPLADPGLGDRFPIRSYLVQGEWMRVMCEPYWGEKVHACPVGIDTDRWRPAPEIPKEFDVLIYDKVRWDHDRYQTELIEPVLEKVRSLGLRFTVVRYGSYKEDDFEALVKRSRAMVFLCEHETQGFAYQQVLSAGVPILAWDRGGYWKDPEYYPDRVKFSPVSSVPNWDSRCGVKFEGPGDFPGAMELFWEGVMSGRFAPRDFILENLTLEHGAKLYLAEWKRAFGA